MGLPLFCFLLALASPAWAFDSTSHYTYDALYRLKTVSVQAAVNGQGPRTLYTTTYTYDKNGNRLTMTKTAAAPEIDSVEELDRQGDIITFEVRGIRFQQGATVTLTLGDGTPVTGTVTELGPTSATVDFETSTWPDGSTSMTVENPDGQSVTEPFTRTQYILTVNVVGSGAVNRDVDPPYYLNDEVQLTPIPGEYFSFIEWSGDLSGSNVPETVTMDADKSVTATFADITAPTVTSVAVQSDLTVDVTFSEPMGTGVTTKDNYAVSGTGQGILSANPDSVAYQTGTTYALTWDSGEMLDGGDITITVSSAQDANGNPVGAPDSGTDVGGGIGYPPTVTIGPPVPPDAETGPVTYQVTYGEADSVTLEVSDVTLHKAGQADGTVTQVSGSGNTSRTVTVDNITGDGKLSVSIEAGTASDLAGNTAAAAGPSANTTVGDIKWVDFSAAGPGDGSQLDPFNTLQDGVDAVSEWGTVRIYNGQTPETPRVTKAMWLEATNGTVRIGVLGGPGALGEGGDLDSEADTGSDQAPSPDDENRLVRLLRTLQTTLLGGPDGTSRLDDVGSDTAAEGERTIYEPVFPYTMAGESARAAQAGSVLAVRLRSEAEIDSGTIWSASQGDAEQAICVEWLPAQQGELRDVWVLFKPTETWYLEELITITAGASTVSGEPVEPVTYEFQVESDEEYQARTASPTEPVWQPEYGEDFDAEELDLSAESADTAMVTAARDEQPAEGLAGGVTTPFAIGPERVYDVPQRVWLPVPEGTDPASVQVFYYHPVGSDQGWYPAANVEGWLVPDSYLHLEVDDTTYLGFLVRHAGIVQLGMPREQHD